MFTLVLSFILLMLQETNAQTNVLEFHNKERAYFDSPPLTWSSSLANTARNLLGSSCVGGHKNSGYGENTYSSWSSAGPVSDGEAML